MIFFLIINILFLNITNNSYRGDSWRLRIFFQIIPSGLHREEKLIDLGSRNFFLCPKKTVIDRENESGSSSRGGDVTKTASSSSCSKEVGVAKTGYPWLKFMDFLL